MDILILGVLGDILGFNNGAYKINRYKVTKKKYGESYIQEGQSLVLTEYYSFIYNGGINKDIENDRYSINTLMLMATLKGINNNKKDFKQGCLDEYTRIYKKVGEKNLKNTYFINNEYLNSLSNLSSPSTINDSMILPRILPFALLFWQKENRKKLITEIIENISLTNKNNILFLSGITLGLFVSYKKHNINKDSWPSKITEYFLSSEFDAIIKELKMNTTEFALDKEDYITSWNEYLNSRLYKNIRDVKYNIDNLTTYKRARTLFLHFNEYNSEEFAYGLKSDQAIIIAYDSLIYCDGSWEKMVILGLMGLTDNSVMGMLSGILFALEYGCNVSVNKEQFRNEGWVKKIISLVKDWEFN
jgi:hypothetical protein